MAARITKASLPSKYNGGSGETLERNSVSGVVRLCNEVLSTIPLAFYFLAVVLVRFITAFYFSLYGHQFTLKALWTLIERLRK
jgi:hypothetical protein